MASRVIKPAVAADALSERLGIVSRYIDASGREQIVPDATVRALWKALAPFDLDTSQPEAALAALDERAAGRVVELVLVVPAGQARLAVPARLPGTNGSIHWAIALEDGQKRSGTARRSGRDRLLQLRIELPLGYHELTLRWADGEARTRVIVVPRRAYQPPSLADGRRIWGVAAQLYALRSRGDWGIGDFGDVLALVERSSSAGADVVGLNPLHALFPDDPDRASPYSPSSRRFLNPLYLQIEAIDDFKESEEARALLERPDSRQALKEARGADIVPYAAIAGLKRRVLDSLYRSFRERHLAHAASRRAVQFREFQCATHGLRAFATFQALREHHAKKNWRDWPADLRSPDAPGISRFVADHLGDVEYFEYEQWQAALQLAAASGLCRQLGLDVGLYLDLAVGFDPDGADAWSLQEVTALGWNIGAPPDALNLKGQNWGLPPLNPARLRECGYGPFIDVLRANMRYAGALRIDHVLGLQRLFWVPEGAAASEGAYIRFAFDELMGIVALESVRNRCLVIGEDLGTVPEGFREKMQSYGVLSYQVLYFNQDRHGAFVKPRRWPRAALATINTHDLPTLKGYWTGRDLELKQSLSLYPDAASAAAEAKDRKRARRLLTDALHAERLPVGRASVPTEQVLRFLGRTASSVAMVQLEDLIGVTEQINVPGTVNEHPNWRCRLPRDIDGIFDDPAVQRLLSALAAERPQSRPSVDAMTAPLSTYRLQLNRDFTFYDAAAIVPYLRRLGISHVYASPILEAQKGSTHGYDTTDYNRLSPELGGQEGFARLQTALRANGLGLLVDFVPNHMGIGKTQNRWWLDLLEFGPDSPFARFFDVDWNPPAWPELKGRLSVPMLGGTVAETLERGDIQAKFDSSRGCFELSYFEDRFPVRPADYAVLIGDDHPNAALAVLAGKFRKTKKRAQVASLKRELAALATDTAVAADLERHASACRNGALQALLDRQVYRLESWQTAASRINYRRFFDINQLAGIAMERPDVFAQCHALTGELVKKNEVHGLRLDHVDGLYDPAGYFRDLKKFLRRQTGRDVYVAIEKILGDGERLRHGWDVDGTTGYEQLNVINGVFVDPAGERGLSRAYEAFIARADDFDEIVHQAKQMVIAQLFGGELTALATRLYALQPVPKLDHDQLRVALTEIAAAFPVYRTYVSARGLSPEDRRIIDGAAALARRRSPKPAHAAIAFARQALKLAVTGKRGAAVDFAARFQQFTAPIMAKSLEDTAFYRYPLLLSLNEVGGNPGRFGWDVKSFHRRMIDQRRDWPRNMIASATHDTKRGEDARARINVLSEIPEEWNECARRWSEINRAGDAPSREDEYLIYQTLIGIWSEDEEGASLGERLKAYVIKAVREAKRRTSWRQPNDDYEKACEGFVDRILRSPEFLDDFRNFHAPIARTGAMNSLAQTVLKLTCPGIPDIYQGTELHDLSLVDPDNRRPVDFARLNDALRRSLGQDPDGWRDESAKLAVVARLLALRRRFPLLFAEGTYEQLAVRGPASKHVLAFARRQGRDVILVAVGRLLHRFATEGEFGLGPDVWHGTSITPPSGRWERFEPVFGGRPSDRRLPAEEVLGRFPVSVLLARDGRFRRGRS